MQADECITVHGRVGAAVQLLSMQADECITVHSVNINNVQLHFHHVITTAKQIFFKKYIRLQKHNSGELEMGHNQNNRVPDINNKPATTHPTSLYVEILEYVFMKRLCCLSCNVSNNI